MLLALPFRGGRGGLPGREGASLLDAFSSAVLLGPATSSLGSGGDLLAFAAPSGHRQVQKAQCGLKLIVFLYFKMKTQALQANGPCSRSKPEWGVIRSVREEG